MKSLVFFLLFIISGLFSPPIISQNFTQTDLDFPGFTGGNIIWGDYNNDGNLDILFAGGPYPWNGFSTIYKNNGDNTFTLLQNSYLIPLSNGNGAWVDINNDGLLDIVISGYYQLLNRPITKVYINNGNDTFTESPNNIIGLYFSTTSCADFDNNGTIDFVVSGLDKDFNTVTKLYRNLGNSQFEEVNISLAGVWNGSSAWGDFNNDGKIDLIISGKDNIDNNVFTPVTRLYKNEGNGSFTEVTANIAGVFSGSVNWGDYNNDGLLDILVTGDRKFENFGYDAAYTAIYKNLGNETFEEDSIELPGLINSTGIWADINNDGNLDILLSGSNSVFGIEPFTKLLLNDGNGNFSESIDSLSQLAYSVASWGDFNNDTKLDFVLSGYDKDQQTYVTYLYENISQTLNSKPSVPSGLSEEISSNGVKLLWNPSIDPETGSKSITYNIRIGSSPGLSDIYSAMTLNNSGVRLIPAFGNTNHNTSWEISGLEQGEYYWSVQAIDNGFLASEFASEKSFIIQSPTSVENEIFVKEFKLDQNYPNPFNPSTVVSYSIPQNSFVTLKVFDALGNEVATLINETQNAGYYNINFDAGRLSSGVYLYKITANKFVQTKKMILMR